MEDQQSSLIKVAKQRIQELRNGAWEAYRNGQLMLAATVYENALQLAESMRLETEYEYLRFMLGVCLFEAGELRQALIALAPNLQEAGFRRDPLSAYKASTVYLDVAVRLPIDLQVIHKADANIEAFLGSTGHSSWKHRLLFQRSRLFAERGRMQAALSTAQEAWSAWKAETDRASHPYYNCDAHLNQLVTMALKLNNTSLARAYMKEWEERECGMPIARDLMRLSCQSELALCEGRVQDAVDCGRQAVLVAKLHDHHGALFRATSGLLRALLCCGDSVQARTTLAELLTWRHSQDAHEQYTTLLLRADYHLVRIQQLLVPSALSTRLVALFFSAHDFNAAPSEHQTENVIVGQQRTLGILMRPPKQPLEAKMDLRLDLCDKQTGGSQKTVQLVAFAQRAYAEALKVGRAVDSRLECAFRQNEISGRLSRLMACVGCDPTSQVTATCANVTQGDRHDAR